MARTDNFGPVDRNPSAPARRVAFDGPRGTDVAVPLDVRSTPGFIAMSSLVGRRPPEMPLSDAAADFRSSGIGPTPPVRAQTIHIDPTLFEGSIDLGYRLASLIVRREAAVGACDIPQVQAGFGELMRMLRMFEHLHILRTPGGTG